MFPEKKRIAEKDCPVCYAAHDEEIHEATLRLRHWFHNYVTRHLEQEEFFAGTANEEYVSARVA
jgi:hypothetical protein